MRRILLVACLALLVVPAAARAGHVPAVGARLGLFLPPATFAAGTPFHVEHGFTCEAGKQACLSGLTHFDLYVDGEQVPSAVDLTFGAGGSVESKLSVSNFRDGLSAGPHTFRGEWYYLGTLVDTREATIQFV